MAVTETSLPGNGTAGPFTYTFPALEAAHVKVSLDNVAQTVGVDYSLDFVQKQITFLVAPYPTAAETIRIYRETDDAALEATFYSGAAIRATDLNNNFNQTLYVAQETKNLTIQASTGNLADGSITNNLLANEAVTTTKIVDANVTEAKLSFTPLKSTDLGVTVQAYDADTAKLDVAQTFTADQTFTATQTYPKVPQNAKTSAYTLVATDAGKHISITTGGVTIPQNVFGVGDAISIYNNSGGSQSLIQGSGVTLRLAGSSVTGNRTIALYGLCTILCVASNTFVVSGAGLS